MNIVEAPKHSLGRVEGKKPQTKPDIGLIRPDTIQLARGFSLPLAMVNCLYREGAITSDEGEHFVHMITVMYHDLLFTSFGELANGRLASGTVRRIAEGMGLKVKFDKLDFRHASELVGEMSHITRRNHPMVIRKNNEGLLVLPSARKNHGIIVTPDALFEPDNAQQVEFRDISRDVVKTGGSVRYLKSFERVRNY